ncbi:uncharacterized protein [Amphiura filiformis]|uniref:uncharacterized protein n=1 Tax=Amphiura filiformis TaxID=82378 RepID=UPI003B215D0D
MAQYSFGAAYSNITAPSANITTFSANIPISCANITASSTNTASTAHIIASSANTSQNQGQAQTVKKFNGYCYVCNQRGHRNTDCQQWQTTPCLRCGNHHPVNKYCINLCSFCGKRGHNVIHCKNKNEQQEAVSNQGFIGPQIPKRSSKGNNPGIPGVDDDVEVIFESINSENTNQKQGEAKTKDNSLYCYICHQRGHRNIDCRQKMNQLVKQIELCLKCGQRHHWNRQCRICHSCKQPGHIQIHCKNKKKRWPQLPVKVNTSTSLIYLNTPGVIPGVADKSSTVNNPGVPGVADSFRTVNNPGVPGVDDDDLLPEQENVPSLTEKLNQFIQQQQPSASRGRNWQLVSLLQL